MLFHAYLFIFQSEFKQGFQTFNHFSNLRPVFKVHQGWSYTNQNYENWQTASTAN